MAITASTPQKLLLLEPFQYETAPPLVFTENEWDNSPALSCSPETPIDLFAELDLVEVSFPPPPPPTPAASVPASPEKQAFVEESTDLLSMLLQSYNPPTATVLTSQPALPQAPMASS